MLYYRVLKDGIMDFKSGYTTIVNELVTEKEKEKKFPALSEKVFDTVEISKRNVYWSFGARFEIKD